MSIKIVLITAPRGEKAQSIAKTLVEEGLAACVNIAAGVQSIYFWQGKVQNEVEDLLVVKTSQSKLEPLEKRLQQVHPYSVPEFVVLDPSHVSKAYSTWVHETLESSPL